MSVRFAIVSSGDNEWLVTCDGYPYLRASPGGTGSCWNLRVVEIDGDDALAHVCNLDDLIAALEAFRDSPVHRDHVQHWQ